MVHLCTNGEWVGEERAVWDMFVCVHVSRFAVGKASQEDTKETWSWRMDENLMEAGWRICRQSEHCKRKQSCEGPGSIWEQGVFVWLWIQTVTIVEYVCVQSHPTLCDPMDCSPADSSVHGIFQAGILGWVAISYSRGSSCSRNRTLGFITTETPRKPWCRVGASCF